MLLLVIFMQLAFSWPIAVPFFSHFRLLLGITLDQLLLITPSFAEEESYDECLNWRANIRDLICFYGYNHNRRNLKILEFSLMWRIIW